MNDELCESHIATDVPQPTIDAIFHKQRHITYWKRNLRTYLPHYYTSNDCHRLLLVFFILSALDLLGILNESTTAEERAGWADWIYTCQHPKGGFRGSPALDLRERRSQENADWDPANIPGTYFALSALLLLRDDLTRVNRKGCLEWLNKMQRPDGSFGETVTADGEIHGGMDTRFAYTATGVRWILRGRREGEVDGIPDIDGVALTKCIAMSETYEGGISEMPFHEPHGGYTYCALATLSFLGRLSSTMAGGQVRSKIERIESRVTAPSDVELTTQWLLSRQTTILDEDEADDEADRPAMDPLPAQDTSSVGWNGRCNKIADTCYCWWGAAALDLLGRIDLCDQKGTTEFLLTHTQHKIAGGFGKHGGSPPDLYHSYLGLTVLSVFRHPDIKTIHPAACFSWDTVDFLDGLEWRKEIWDQPEASLFERRD